MLDGFSFANLGAEQKLTSAELAFNAERIAKQGKDRSIKDVDEASKGRSSIRKEDLTEKEGGGYSLGGDSSKSEGKKQEDLEDQDDENDSSEGVEKDSKFVVKLNKETNMLELTDVNTNTVIQTINPEELSEIALKMSNPSGIIVNKKI